jgi:hypothetical protein
MSGFIEDKWDRVASKYLPKIRPEFKDKAEINLGIQHFWQMLAITMSLNTIALFTNKYLFIGSLLSLVLIAIAEWPPKGRLIDVLTRGAGWLVGASFAVYGLIR